MLAIGRRVRLWRRYGAAALLWACVWAGFASTPSTGVEVSSKRDEQLIVSPVGGRSLGGWTAEWWRWGLSLPIEPWLDPDGRFCDLDQLGEVWFLAGTNGRLKPKRHCVVPEGKYLLLPVINMIQWQRNEAKPLDCRSLRASVAVNNDSLAGAVVLLDGRPLGDIKQRRVRSDGCFHLDAEDPSSPLAAADGYWVMLKPLPRGRHTISVGANYASPDSMYGNMHQSFEYELDVGGEALLSGAARKDIRGHRRG